MPITILLQIITVSITFLTLLIDIIYKTVINKKTRTFNVIGQELIDRLDNIRKAYAEILKLTEPSYVASAKESNKKGNRFNAIYCFTLNKARAKIRTNSWPFWDKEKRVHNSMDALCKAALKYYEDEDESLVEKINTLRDEFFIECSIYDWAMWEFCQKQINGEKINRREMDEHYFEILTRIHNSGSDQTMKFKEAFKKIYNNYKQKISKEGDK